MYLLDPNMNTFKEKPHASVGSQKGQKIEITHIILNDAQSTRLFLSNLIFRMDSTACSVGVRLWSFKPDPDGRIMGLGTYHLPNLNLPYIPKLSLTDGPPLPFQPAFLAWQPLIDPKLFSFPPASPLPTPNSPIQSKQSLVGQPNCVGQWPFLFFPTHAQVE